MRIDARTKSPRGLLRGAVLLPFLAAACGGLGSSSDSAGQRDDNVVSENANDKIAFDYFVSKGLTDVQAAGIVGNLDQESGMSPTISQIGGGPGRGIAQWSAGARWDVSAKDNVAWYAAQQGASVYSLDLQLEFIWYELTTIGYGYSKLLAATTVTEAVVAFQDYYEMCGACASSNRVAHANAALAAFGGSSPPPPPPGPTSCSVGGVSGTCIDTATCAAMTGYVSTAGHCPGAANIECCTPDGSSSSSSSSSTSSSSSGSPPPACNVNGVAGTCIQTSDCALMAGYVSTPGFCPGAASEECCTPPPACNVNGVAGTCIDTGSCAAMGGTSTAGLCPGAANIECCTQ